MFGAKAQSFTDRKPQMRVCSMSGLNPESLDIKIFHISYIPASVWNVVLDKRLKRMGIGTLSCFMPSKTSPDCKVIPYSIILTIKPLRNDCSIPVNWVDI